MEESSAVRSLLALAQATRLKIFRTLVVAGADGMTPGALTEALDIPATGLSFHLKELAGAGLVSQERQGRNIVYRASFDRMNDLLGYLTENCCRGKACSASENASCKC